MLKQLRPINLLLVLMTLCVVDAFLFQKMSEHIWLTKEHIARFFIYISTLSICAWGYLDNDIQDIDIDVINQKKQHIELENLIKYCRISLIINILLIITIFIFDIYIGTLESCILAILWYYNRYGKRQFLIGNLLVATLCSFVVLILFIYYIRLGIEFSNTAIFENYLIFSFILTLLREVVKDAEDIEGDRSNGAKTLPILFGKLPTKIYIVTLIFLVAFECLFFSISLKNESQSTVFQLFMFPSIFTMLYFLAKAKHKKDYTRMSLLCKIIMTFGIFFLFFIR